MRNIKTEDSENQMIEKIKLRMYNIKKRNFKDSNIYICIIYIFFYIVHTLEMNWQTLTEASEIQTKIFIYK